MEFKLRADAISYRMLEITFFSMFFFIFPILSDLEYNIVEMNMASISFATIKSDLLHGTFNALIFFSFYILVHRYLLPKKYKFFALSVLAFLVVYHYYFQLIYFIVLNFDVFPEQLKNEAIKLSAERNHLNFSFVYMFLQFLSISALAYFIQSSSQQNEMKALREQKLISELGFLKAQLQPHFFFNTLNSIYALSLAKSEDAAALVAKLAHIMRYIIYETGQEKVELLNEIAFLSDYIELERIRHADNIAIQFDVQGIKVGEFMEPLLLLPFIENAFKHGIWDEMSEGFVNVIICNTEKELILEVENSKPVAAVKTYANGIGLKNVVKRLDLLYKNSYHLEITDMNSTYNISLVLKKYD